MQDKAKRSNEPSGNILSASHTTLKAELATKVVLLGRGLRCARPPGFAAITPQGPSQQIVLTGGFQDRVEFRPEEWAEL